MNGFAPRILVAALVSTALLMAGFATTAAAGSSASRQSSAIVSAGKTLRAATGSDFACYRPDSRMVGRASSAVVFVTSRKAQRRAKALLRRKGLARVVKVKLTAATDTDAERNAMWKDVQKAINGLTPAQQANIIVDGKIHMLAETRFEQSFDAVSCEERTLTLDADADEATEGVAYSLQSRYGAQRLAVGRR